MQQRSETVFTDTDKLKALAVVNIFETGKAFGDFTAVAVLKDGAGVSYGMSQFTHRSGALAAVLEAYLQNGGTIGRSVIEDNLAKVRKRTPQAISDLAADGTFTNALRTAGISHEMKTAQIDVAFTRFLKSAIDACEKLGFVFPLSLAIVYDSMNHGSWERLRDEISKELGFTGTAFTSGPRSDPNQPHLFEQPWIETYVKRRDKWLASVDHLAATRYRTRFFLNQIKLSNWELKLPVRVQGMKLTNNLIESIAKYISGLVVRIPNSAVGPALTKKNSSSQLPPQSSNSPQDPPDRAQPPDPEKDRERCLDAIESDVNSAAAKYDQVERIATTVTTRNDAAKSLWTTILGSLSQTFWALFGLLAGIPREVWLVVAVIAAALMLLYLYRQIELGRIREQKS